jgi:hypothetical protein
MRMRRIAFVCALIIALVLEGDAVARAQDDTRKPIPVEGSMRDLIQDTVGPFTLENAKSFIEMLEQGATDAANLLYRSQQGAEIYHIISVFPSSEASGAYLEAVAGKLQAEGWSSLGGGQIRDENGERVGSLIVLGGPSSVIVWTNRELALLATGPQEYVRSFYDALPY